MGKIINFSEKQAELETLAEFTERAESMGLSVKVNPSSPYRDYEIPQVPDEWIELSRCEADKIYSRIPLIMVFSSLINIANESGILGCNDYIQDQEESYFKTVLNRVMDGYKINEVEEFLAGTIQDSTCRGEELFEMIIIREGTLLLMKQSKFEDFLEHFKSHLKRYNYDLSVHVLLDYASGEMERS